jgi:D-glycero-D-manno-heptose 1,7-bisphosphate phosphatase
VALDRDNTIIEDAGYTDLTQDPHWLPGVISGLQLITSHGYGLVLMTNQAALSKGIINLSQLEDFHVRLNESFKRQTGLEFNSIFVCPHSKDNTCPCRKPRAGMFESAKEIFGVFPEFMIGDSVTDIEAANFVGVHGIKVERNGFYRSVSEWLDSK